jgi:hypothetical protein
MSSAFNKARLLWTLLWMSVSPGFAIAATTFQCDTASIAALRSRLLDSSKKLASVVTSADVAHVSVCADAAGDLASEVNQALRGYRTVSQRQCEIDAWDNERLSGAAKLVCAGVRECTVELLLIGDLPARRRDSTCPYALSGGLSFAAFLGHLGNAGHFEVTKGALDEFGKRANRPLSSVAARILQEASRDADVFDWDTPAAHAQEHADDSGDLPAVRDGGDRFVTWSACGLRAARDACVAGRPRAALYLLGYSLHGVQDLVFHAGISNAEHSYRDVYEDAGIDFREHYSEKMALAARVTTSVMEQFAARLSRTSPAHAGCWAAMQSWSGSGPLKSEEKQALLGEKDFGISAYLRYRNLADTVNTRLQAGERRSKIFLQERWLPKLNSQATDVWLERIDNAVWAKAESPKACRRMNWKLATE